MYYLKSTNKKTRVLTLDGISHIMSNAVYIFSSSQHEVPK